MKTPHQLGLHLNNSVLQSHCKEILNATSTHTNMPPDVQSTAPTLHLMLHSASSFRSLYVEWSTFIRSPATLRSLRRWSRGHEALQGISTLNEIVRRCDQNGSDHETKSAILRALAAEARDDTHAARVVLQALIPGLVRLSERMSGYVGPSSPVWTDRSQLNQDVISIAFECIRICDLPTHVSPAVVLLDRTRRRLRMRVANGDRQPKPTPSYVLEKIPADNSDPLLVKLDSVLSEALQQGVIRSKDAAIIFTSRVLGTATAEIAANSGRKEDAVRRQRNRAERALIGHYDELAG